MTLSAEDKKNLSNIRITKAYEFLEDAKANHRDERYKTSINRSYYAILHAVRSILILEGMNQLPMTGLEFHKQQWQAIHKTQQIRAAGFYLAGNAHL